MSTDIDNRQTRSSGSRSITTIIVGFVLFLLTSSVTYIANSLSTVREESLINRTEVKHYLTRMDAIEKAFGEFSAHIQKDVVREGYVKEETNILKTDNAATKIELRNMSDRLLMVERALQIRDGGKKNGNRQDVPVRPDQSIVSSETTPQPPTKVSK